MRKFTILLAAMLLCGFQAAFAQVEITGTVTSAEDGSPLPGVTVIIKGTTIGTTTDINGKYSIEVPEDAEELLYSFVGMATKEVMINDRRVINVELETSARALDEVVVTALGISREKKSLGYATQEVSGEEINKVKRDNVVNTLSGRVAGVQVKNNTNMGGSSNIVIRGYSSLTGNNQALFVVDGVPVDNSNTNNAGQLSGRNGYDYGNAASDINPADIEEINVLKGAAATALYGSRAANGVIIITTKKGKKRTETGKALGVRINSNVTVGFVDESTFPKYQQNYGAGYGPYYSGGDYPGLYQYDLTFDGETYPNALVVPTTEDASFGTKFDPNLLVWQYDAFIPESDNFGKPTPWVAPENGPLYFLDNSVSLTNTVDISGGGDYSTFRLAYTNLDQTGILPNSELKKNNFTLSGTYDVLDNLKVTGFANYIATDAKGRNRTGYSDNIFSSFRQWWQVNVDLEQQERLYDRTGRNVTWNPVDPETNRSPIYWDNPYWQRYENFQTDERDRIIGYTQVDWEITPELSAMGRIAVDNYSELREERKAIGSVAGEFGVGRPDITSGYARFERTFLETNLDFILKYGKYITEDFNIDAFIGTNIRRTKVDRVFASTNGGLSVPDIYALSNSASPMVPPDEFRSTIGVNGIFGSVSFGFKELLYLDATIRRDQSSTLPEDNNAYFYPSVSTSFLFHNVLDADWMSLGKLRLNYAEVGSDAPFASVADNYILGVPFGGIGVASVPNTKNNPDLVPERTKSLEGGIEMNFLNNRFGFDVAVYQTRTVDQIIPVSVSFATGYSAKFVNAGEIENKGVELRLHGTPVRTGKFKWDISANWAANQNEVVSLAEGIENIQLAALQGGVTINARVGEPYGAIQGQDFIYIDGQKVVGSNGYYLKSPTSDIVLGNINPDWNLGINNSLSYMGWTFSFLFDFQEGGSIFSLDQYYGLATGLYEETDYTNDLGNPVRAPLDEGGGLILEGVKEDGTPNDIRVSGSDYRVFGYSQNPNAAFIYDASYIKLREVVLTYTFPKTMMDKTFIEGASLSLVGSNVWILAKDLPHADPEASQSSGNIQGWQSGVMPTTRNIGFSINVQF